MPLIGLLIFLAVPIIEIAIFIQVGDLIGLWPTLACIVATAIIGGALIRIQGFAVLAQAQQSMARNRVPVEQVIHGLFLFVAGALLLTPGFFTDAIGFVLLVPPLRIGIARWIWARIVASDRFTVHTSGGRGGPGPRPEPGRDGRGPIIEGEVVDETEDDKGRGTDATPPEKRNSPWRQ